PGARARNRQSFQPTFSHHSPDSLPPVTAPAPSRGTIDRGVRLFAPECGREITSRPAAPVPGRAESGADAPIAQIIRITTRERRPDDRTQGTNRARSEIVRRTPPHASMEHSGGLQRRGRLPRSAYRPARQSRAYLRG